VRKRVCSARERESLQCVCVCVCVCERESLQRDMSGLCEKGKCLQCVRREEVRHVNLPSRPDSVLQCVALCCSVLQCVAVCEKRRGETCVRKQFAVSERDFVERQRESSQCVCVCV